MAAKLALVLITARCFTASARRDVSGPSEADVDDRTKRVAAGELSPRLVAGDDGTGERALGDDDSRPAAGDDSRGSDVNSCVSESESESPIRRTREVGS